MRSPVTGIVALLAALLVVIVGYMSRASTMISEKAQALMPNATPVSLGYDRVRFMKPVFLGDTIYPEHEVVGLDRKRSAGLLTLRVALRNQRDEIVLEVIGDEAGVVAVDRVRLGYRDGMHWATHSAGSPAVVTLLSR